MILTIARPWKVIRTLEGWEQINGGGGFGGLGIKMKNWFSFDN